MVSCPNEYLTTCMCETSSPYDLCKDVYVSGQGTYRRRSINKNKKTNKNKRCSGLLARTPKKAETIKMHKTAYTINSSPLLVTK